MERIIRIGTVTVGIAAIVLIINFLVSVIYGPELYYRMKRDGQHVADAIYASDRSVDVGCYTDGHGHADIVIRGVDDTTKQDQIITCAKRAKSAQHIRRRIVITFQKKTMPEETIIREVDI
jgi:hypothetical protein